MSEACRVERKIETLSLRFDGERLSILDQQALPDKEVWIELSTLDAAVSSIQALKVRGAPLIGVTAALSLGLLARRASSFEEVKSGAERLASSRPTAVNLMAAIERCLRAVKPDSDFRVAVLEAALNIAHEDVALCEALAAFGEPLIEDGDQVLTHCNTGGLATAGIGTALGVIRRAHELGKRVHVYVDETRPLLQGGRLTTWELSRLGIDYTLITDSMAATLMRQGRIQKVFVGADRVALNGDFANKIGTYGVAVLAKHHGIPFYPVMPVTTIDPDCPNGDAIVIESRHPEEVRGFHALNASWRWAPATAPVFNPAFDVTPVEYITALVCDKGLFSQIAIQEGGLAAIVGQLSCFKERK